MQLGTRWAMGAQPPAKLSAEVIAAVRRVEEEAAELSPQRGWTLTWLEGRPVLELDPADDSDEIVVISGQPTGVKVTIGAAGSGYEWVEDEL